MKKAAIAGAIEGGVAWILYAAWECVFSILLPYFTSTNEGFAPAHWAFMTVLWIVYLFLGLGIGAACGLAQCALGHPKPQTGGFKGPSLAALANCSVVFVFACNLLWRAPGSHLFIGSAVAVCAGTIAAIVALDAHPEAKVFGRFLFTPWCLYGIMLGLVWLRAEVINRPVPELIPARAPYVVALVLIVVLGNKAASAIRNTQVRRAFASPSRRLCAIAIIVGILFAAAAGLHKQTIFINAAGNNSAAAGRPNIILIVMDTVRADHLSLYGYPKNTTPNLELLATNAAVYEKAMAPSDTTLASHASIFTGAYALQHGAFTSPEEYPGGRAGGGGIATLPEALAKAGYFTIGVVSNVAFVTNSFGFARGFNHFDQTGRRRFLEPRGRREFFKDSLRLLLNNFDVRRELALKWRRAGEINKEVFALIEEQGAKRNPFFLFINYMDAHQPYAPPPPYDSMFSDKNAEVLTRSGFAKLKNQMMLNARNISEAERQYLVSQYDGGIAYIDAQIGELIRHLKDEGLYDNSYLIITSDHGEAFGERNMLGHGCGVYHDQIHVPLIIAGPKSSPATRVGQVVSLVDLFPTILETAGVRLNAAAIEAHSLRSTQSEESARTVISESYPKVETPKRIGIERAVISNEFKFVWSTAGKRELFDLQKDPFEKEDLSQKMPSVMSDFEGKFTSWTQAVSLKAETPKPVGKDVLENLKSLGYLK